MVGQPNYFGRTYWSDADSAYIAEAPDLPGCAADGRARNEAVVNLKSVISEWIETEGPRPKD